MYHIRERMWEVVSANGVWWQLIVLCHFHNHVLSSQPPQNCLDVSDQAQNRPQLETRGTNLITETTHPQGT